MKRTRTKRTILTCEINLKMESLIVVATLATTITTHWTSFRPAASSCEFGVSEWELGIVASSLVLSSSSSSYVRSMREVINSSSGIGRERKKNAESTACMGQITRL